MRLLSAGRLLLAPLLIAVSVSAAAIEPLGFDDPDRDARYQALLHELRCMVCQNQSLASSNADLAADMRVEVHRMVAAGRSNAEVKAFLVDRYGEFVLYKPPVSAKTWLLWFGPGALALVGVAVLLVAVRRRWRHAPPADMQSDDHERLRALLNRHEDP